MRYLLFAAAAITLVSVEQEIEIGREANAQIRKEMPELTDAQARSYVRDVGRRLAQAAPGPKYPYSFSIVNSREINAFALPGGPVLIHRGVLQAAANESQLAGVLAHEIAHIAQRHAADQLTAGVLANFGLGVLGALLGNSGGAGAAQMAAGFIANGVFLKFSRDDEREADRVGLQIMERAGWDPHGLAEFMQVLHDQQQRSPSSVQTFFSSHPSPAGRVRDLQTLVNGKSGRRNSDEFQAIKSRLNSLPPAQAMPKTN